MSDLAISISGLGKQYRIVGSRARYGSLREKLASAAGALFRRNAGSRKEQTIWALKDISLTVRQGEIVGIIGRNGAGKSTLLKILSRITEPTEGFAEVHGQVGSLLEVGTGFHPELSGRDNVFLNGAILGMRRQEIAKRFDEIVAFSEVEKFIDTPVKHYSSGMYVRLAFAVAAHLQAENLLVDEVLAVGDAAFQRKCLGKLGEIARQGKTIVFVSHSLSTVQTLCQRGIMLRHGEMFADGRVRDVVTSYLRTLDEAASAATLAERTDRSGQGKVRLTAITVSSSLAEPAFLATGRPAYFTFELSGLRPGTALIFTIYDVYGQPVSTFQTDVRGPQDKLDPALGARFVWSCPQLPMRPGDYRLNAAVLAEGKTQDHVEGAIRFVVEQGVFDGRSIRPDGTSSFVFPYSWTLPAG
jgi:lipopolysaccharide transport system ATP-binding protein